MDTWPCHLPSFPKSPWWNSILVGEFGVITMTTTYLLFLLLPLVTAFYIVLSLMEDSYLPRVSRRWLTGC